MSHQFTQSNANHSSISARSQQRKFARLIAAMSLTAMLTLTGCQGFGLRSRENEFAFLDENDDDDWSVPNPSPSVVPRPTFADTRNPSGTSRSANRPSESRYGNKDRNGSAPQPAIVGYGPKNEKSKETSGLASIMTTKDADLDLDGALATLPPEYRDKLKLQFEAVRDRYAANQNNSSANTLVAKDSVSEKRSLNDSISQTTEPEPSPKVELATTNIAPSPATTSSPNNAQVAVATEKKPAVSIRMSDSINESSTPDGSLALASSKTNIDSSVVQASANTSPFTTASSIPSIVPQDKSPATWRQEIGKAIELLEKQIAETPNTDENLKLSQEITLRMLYVSQRKLDEALKPIEHLSESEQQFVHHQMIALYEASNPDAMPVRSRHWSLVMNSQREATHHLAAASNLEVKSIAFCTEVERYGLITKFPKTQFQADQEVLLYCEIENVSAEAVRNGFETQLQGSYEIIDSQGRKVADQLLPMEPDVCQNHRRDYFIVYKIYMPQQIASGNYQLRLTVEDMKARKFGQGQIDFQIKK